MEDSDELMLVGRGAYDGIGERAVTRISGFVRGEDGQWERFEETAFNTVFDLAAVRRVLLEGGLTPVHFARLDDLAAPLDEPEREGRVFVVARRPA